MKLSDYLQEDGTFIDENQLHYEDAANFIQTRLGFCCCGRPEENVWLILQGLRLIDEKSPNSHHYPEAERDPSREAWEEWWKGHKEREKAIFGSGRLAYFFYYWADMEGLTEHGGSVPGWLDDKGKDLLSLLEEMVEGGHIEDPDAPDEEEDGSPGTL